MANVQLLPKVQVPVSAQNPDGYRDVTSDDVAISPTTYLQVVIESNPPFYIPSTWSDDDIQNTIQSEIDRYDSANNLDPATTANSFMEQAIANAPPPPNWFQRVLNKLTGG